MLLHDGDVDINKQARWKKTLETFKCFVIQNFVGPSANLKGSKGYNFAKFLFQAFKRDHKSER